MPVQENVSIEAWKAEIEALQAERKLHIQLLAPLLGQPQHRDAVDGYLKSIDSVNASITRLAKLIEGAMERTPKGLGQHLGQSIAA